VAPGVKNGGGTAAGCAAVLTVLAFTMSAFARTPELPVVHLDTTSLVSAELPQADAARLRGWLLTRLLGEGYVVAATEVESDVTLSVGSTQAGFFVRAAVSERATAATESAEPAAAPTVAQSYLVQRGATSVVSVEILHRAVAALEQVGDQIEPSVAPSGVKVALEITGAPSPELAAKLGEELALSLSEKGATLTPEAHDHELVACVKLEEKRVLTGLAATSAECLNGAQATDIAPADPETLAFVRGQIDAQFPLAEENARRNLPAASTAKGVTTENPASTALADDASVQDTGPSLDAELDAIKREPPKREEKAWSLALAGGALGRGGGVDPLFDVRVERRLTGRLRARLQGELSFSSVGDLDVVEPAFLGGLTVSEPFGSDVGHSVGLLAGARLHHFDYAADDEGLRSNWMLALPFELSLFRGSYALDLGIEPGIAGPTRDHEILGKRAWWRSASFIGFTLAAKAAL
jgi:hypothetical protein